jgi:hypothetical protein
MISSLDGQLHLLSFNCSQQWEPSAERLVFVHAQLTDTAPWAAVDAAAWEAAGLYEAWVPGDFTDGEAASSALGALFEKVAVELALFDFRVFDGMTGLRLGADVPSNSVVGTCLGIRLIGHLG